MTAAAIAQAMLVKNVGNDQFTKVLLHFDNGVVDYAAGASAAHTWTLNSATISAAASKFGGASLAAGGSQWLDTPDSADYTLGSGDFTIDFWFNVSGGAGSRRFAAGQISSGGTAGAWAVELTAANVLRGVVYKAGVQADIIGATTITTTGWHHAAFVRTGTNLMLFLDGVQQSSTLAFTGSVDDSSDTLAIGRGGALSSLTWNGFIDEFRMSVGTARWTAAFTPPGIPYS